MVGINCLFSYEGVNYRLNIDTRSGKEGISFDELKRNLRDHPKLKEVDLFDGDKYVIEIFDKGFDDYVKLPKDFEICDYTKLRARLRPKSSLNSVKKSEEPRKRPLSMYSEINLEEEHAQKVLRGSPPPSSVTPRIRASSPPSSSSFRRSYPGNDTTRSEHKSSSNTKPPVQSKPSPSMVSTPPFKPKAQPNKPTPPKARPLQQSSPACNTRPPAPTKPPVVQKTPDTTSNPFASNNSPHTPSINKISGSSSPSRVSGFLANENNLPPGVDQDSYLLTRAVGKYNDEFTNIVMFDDIWTANHVWPFVFREISGQVKTISDMKEARSAFKSMVDKYIEILQKPHLTEAVANQLWPLFDIFHTKLNIKPFYGRIQALIDTFNKGNKVSEDDPKSMDQLSKPTEAPLSQQAPKPQRPQSKVPSDDIILLSCDDLDKPEMDDEDEIQEVPPFTSPPRATTPPTMPTSLSPLQTRTSKPDIVVTSDDFRLLMFVEDHNSEFIDNEIPEFTIWKEITDQLNLFKPFELSLVMKYKTRFYELLREFIRIDKSTMPPHEKAKWRLYSIFVNINIDPFLNKI